MFQLPRIANRSSLFCSFSVFMVLILGGLFEARGEEHKGKFHVLQVAGRNSLYVHERGKDFLLLGEQVTGITEKYDRVFVRRVLLESYECKDRQGSLITVTLNTHTVEYWMFDSRGHKYGPYDRKGYDKVVWDKFGELVEIEDQYRNFFVKTDLPKDESCEKM